MKTETNTDKKKKIISFILITGFTILAVLITIAALYIYQVPGLPQINGISAYGRYLSIPFFDMNITADPNKKKLMKYLEKNYDESFTIYEVSSDDHNSEPYNWNCEWNGIVVTCDSYPDEYFHVYDWYGYIIDDYAPYLIKDDCEKFIYDTIAPYMNVNYDMNVKYAVRCIPDNVQVESFTKRREPAYFLKYGQYSIEVIIHSDGKNSESDLNAVCPVLYDYYFGNEDVKDFYKNAPSQMKDRYLHDITLSFIYISDDSDYEQFTKTGTIEKDRVLTDTDFFAKQLYIEPDKMLQGCIIEAFRGGIHIYTDLDSPEKFEESSDGFISGHAKN